MEWLVIFVPLVHLILTPFTKVEESFNIQATHDVLFHHINITAYDHLQYPGVVPRTFIGPLVIGAFSAPFIFFCKFLHIGTLLTYQIIVRTALCLSVVFSLIYFQRTMKKFLGAGWSYWFLLVTASQFHLLYYSSRPLPNMMALPLVLMALSFALSSNHNAFVFTSGAAIIWFRTELAILLGLVYLIMVLDGKFNIVQTLKVAVPTGIVLVAVTFLIDSMFWKRPVWPEAEVFYFNVILNKSGDWGTSPFLWYMYSALPRGLGSSLLLVPLGLFYESRIRRLVGVAFVFILLFSFLPHKELRFVIHTFPIINAAVAAACHRLWINRNKSPLQWLLGMGVWAHLVVNVFLSVFLLMVARVNYPGGEAIIKLHQVLPAGSPVHVHIGNLAAQTGVSRFTEFNPNWRYSKEENLSTASLLQFSHLLVEAKSKYSANLKPFSKTHTVLASVEGFSEIVMNYQLIPPVRIKTKPLIFILERNANVVVPNVVITSEEQDKEMPDQDIEEINEESVEDATVDDGTKKVVSSVSPSGDNSGETENILNNDGINEVQEKYQVDIDELDDLIAMETNDKNIEFRQFAEQLQEKLNSAEVLDNNAADLKDFDFEQILLDQDIIKDIKSLANMPVDEDNPDIDQLKKALKNILSNLKDNVLTDRSEPNTGNDNDEAA